jgi:hypothetical protein
MISIKKPKEPPNILQERGKKEIDDLCLAFLKHQADYESGAMKFKFDSGIYGSKSVKNALIKAQHDKCFLCESKITHISYGDVEHFRPKGGSRQSVDEKDMKVPGYYWLAYIWENLFLACQICNQRFKKNLFPLENPKDRAISHENDLSKEKPVFINPETENPENFISFRGEIPFAVDGNIRGKITIEATGINRDELNEMRLATLKKLKMIYELANGNPQIPESIEAMNYLQECQSDFHEYAAAIRANMKDEFRFVLK